VPLRALRRLRRLRLPPRPPLPRPSLLSGARAEL
jgi:hypothetical protein